MDPNAADEALERMLSGAPVADEWRDVASFVGELQDATPSSVLASEDLHVAAMVETAHLLAEKGDPAVRPVSNAAAPAVQASRLPKQRRKPMKSIVTKVLAPIAAVLTVFGGMAYAGALPHTVQKAVSHAAGTVGINVPSDDEGSGEVPGEDDQGEDTQGDEGKDEITPQDPGDDQGESSDDQGESSDDTTSSDDQGENDDSQGDNDNQGEDSQGDSTDQTSGDDQGDTSQTNDQGDQGGDTQSGDTTDGGGDQGDSQN